MNVDKYKHYSFNKLNKEAAEHKEADILIEAEEVIKQYDEAFKDLVSR